MNKRSGWFIFWLAVGANIVAAWYVWQEEQGDKVDNKAIPCRPWQGDCRYRFDDGELVWSVESPIRYLKPFATNVQFVEMPVGHIQSVSLEFSMTDMEMAVTRYNLIQREDGRWQGKAVLPVCVSGRSDWQATLHIKTDRSILKARFSFDVP